MKPTNHTVEKQTINGMAVTITTYCLGDQWHCTVANVDPGANIARADGATRDEAVKAAVDKAGSRLKKH